jgi:hypothetical protein
MSAAALAAVWAYRVSVKVLVVETAGWRIGVKVPLA